MQLSGKQGYQILVVDDEPTVCRSIKMLLEHEGHSVVMANSGEAGLELFEAGKFDLVITDYSMAGMDGDELATRIKLIEPGQPVIMATASVYGRNTADQPSACVDFLLAKPFFIKELREAISWVMH